MSSVYFSPADLKLMRTLLSECCGHDPDWDFEKEAAAAEKLANWMHSGVHDEDELRRRLKSLGIKHQDESSALAEWDDEGGAQPAIPRYGEYGRRIESDGTWTIYEVFTGREARQRGLIPSGLTKEEALDRLDQFGPGGVGANTKELRTDGRTTYSFWRRDVDRSP